MSHGEYCGGFDARSFSMRSFLSRLRRTHEHVYNYRYPQCDRVNYRAFYKAAKYDYTSSVKIKRVNINMHFLHLFFILTFIFLVWAQDGVLPLPAISFDETQWYFRHDKHTTSRASEILNPPEVVENIPVRKLRRSYFVRDGMRRVQRRQADDVDTELLAALSTGFEQLFRDNQLVEQVANNIAGNPIPGDFGYIERFPGFEDVTLAAGYM
jgi:hypothetical protein